MVDPVTAPAQDVVCFAKDWTEDPTSNHHVMAHLAESRRVLWINSISMRTPTLGSGRDWKKIARKVRAAARGPQQVQENLWVYTPLVLPLPHSRPATVINRRLLSFMIGALRRKLHIRDFQLWTFLPNAVEFVGHLGESLVVYYCVDNWAKFSYINGDQMAEMERRLCARADVVFATSRSLAEARAALNPNTFLATHGVDYDLFSQALEPDLPVPEELSGLKGPILGFYGLVQDWVDQELLAFLAARHPEWSIVIIGQVCVDTEPLRKHPNVLFLGRKPHAQLPGYCKAFTVGLMPHKVNDLTAHMNPIKLREYLCAGLPVVATALPEVVYYQDFCSVANDYTEFEHAVEQAIQEDLPARRTARNHAMQAETWAGKVAEISAQVSRVQAAKIEQSRQG